MKIKGIWQQKLLLYFTIILMLIGLQYAAGLVQRANKNSIEAKEFRNDELYRSQTNVPFQEYFFQH